MSFVSIIFFLGLFTHNVKRFYPLHYLLSFFPPDDFSSWRIVVIHDSWKDHSNILKTVFLNYLFVLLFSILYSVFNEHLLFDTSLCLARCAGTKVYLLRYLYAVVSVQRGALLVGSNSNHSPTYRVLRCGALSASV